MPVIISLNKEKLPPWEDAVQVSPEEFRNYAPPGRIFVQEHGFGWTVETLPEDEFGT